MSKIPPPELSDQVSWGVIRYAAGSGAAPDEDAAGFDGWYFDRGDARAVALSWVRKYPGWIAALVRSDLIWFGQADFIGKARHWPITVREREFALRDPQDFAQ